MTGSFAHRTTQVVLERYYALQPLSFPAVEKLEIRLRARESPDLFLRLAPREESGPEQIRLYLAFYSVRDLRLEAGALRGFSALDIISIADQGWEGVNYRVYHREQDMAFSFYCDKFKARRK